MSTISRWSGSSGNSTGTGSSAAAGISSSWLVRGYLIALSALLVGYMFMGRGFAHIPVGPVFIGDAVMVAGVAVAGIALVRSGIRPQLNWTLGLLVAFVLLGAARTIPYIDTYGLDALRDGTLWGYAGFALILYILVDRRSLIAGFRTYGWVVPVFALWLPICWNLFRIFSLDIDPNRPGETVPLVFFKGGDMAIHVVGAIAFMILGATAVVSVRGFVWRTLVFVPLLWTIFVAGTSNRGALLTASVGLVAIAVVAGRSRNWRPFLAAAATGLAVLIVQSIVVTMAVSPGVSPLPAESSQPRASSTPSADAASASRPPSAAPTAKPVILANSDFEIGPDASGAIDGWTPRGAEVVVLAEGGADGSAFISMRNPHNPYEATLASDRFAIDDASDIGVSAGVKAIRGRATLEIYVNWYDASGSLITNTFVKALATHGDASWHEFGAAVEAPEDATDAEITLFEAAGHATLGIDRVEVHAGDFISESAPSELPVTDGANLLNGRFDGGIDPIGAPRGWTPRGADVVLVHGNGGPHSTFASIENRFNGYEATLTSNRFAFKAGNDIKVSASARAIRGKPRLEIYLNWYGSAGELISSNFTVALSTDGRSTWQNLSKAIAAPEGAEEAEVKIFEATGHATLGLDDVSIRIGDFGVEVPVVAEGPPGRPATIGQLLENITSVFSDVRDPGLEGTEQFRLAWWGTIVDYTVFGDYFWTGKGFGINLADDDGFQSTADGSLRAPHNSHLTVLARMGVPGFLLWAGLQAAFATGLLRAALSNRRAGQMLLAATAFWLLAYWLAMVIDTSFDPYLEGPQGGIWLWTVIGAGLVVMRLSGERSTT
jgi:hypothetical protein